MLSCELCGTQVESPPFINVVKFVCHKCEPLPVETFNEDTDQNTATDRAMSVFAKSLINRITALKKPNDSGLGDTVERIFAKFGGTQFKWVMDKLGVNCGCEDRKNYLNRVYPY